MIFTGKNIPLLCANDMKKHLVLLIAALYFSSISFSQDTLLASPHTLLSVNESVTADSIVVSAPFKKQPVYELKLAIDLPVTAVTCGLTLYNFSKIYNKDRLTVEEVTTVMPFFGQSSGLVLVHKF
jgi:hypothetical protein